METAPIDRNAEDKASGKAEKITITNDKGRLSQEEIDRMVKESEQFSEEDKKTMRQIEARNSFETYLYSVKTKLKNAKSSDALSEDEIANTVSFVDDASQWLDDNSDADEDTLKETHSELESNCNPVMVKITNGEGKSTTDEKGDESRYDEEEI